MSIEDIANLVQIEAPKKRGACRKKEQQIVKDGIDETTTQPLTHYYYNSDFGGYCIFYFQKGKIKVKFQTDTLSVFQNFFL